MDRSQREIIQDILAEIGVFLACMDVDDGVPRIEITNYMEEKVEGIPSEPFFTQLETITELYKELIEKEEEEEDHYSFEFKPEGN